MHWPASRYWYTLRTLGPTQIANRLWRAVYRPHPAVAQSFMLRTRPSNWVHPVLLEPSMRGPDEFEFLGTRRCVQDRPDWNQVTWPMLWRYHLHYFDDLNARDFKARADWHRALVERWIVENPPTVGVGWDTYPTSVRIVNWIKWWLGGAEASSSALHSARLQLARVASGLEYHLRGNHLLENAKALIFGGLFFDGDDANRWLARGLKVLARQLPEQVLNDGGHFERSAMYHHIVLAGLLDLYNLMRVFDRSERGYLVPYIRRMLRWSSVMRHPDGDIPLFNDAALGEAPSPQSLERYAVDLDIETAAAEAPEDEAAGIHLKASGYVRVTREHYTALMNVGSVAPDCQPGHAHADTLSFELSVGKRRLIVDTGTSTYAPGPRRSWERSTAAHNSIVLNGLNSSDVWGAFRVARRARVLAAAVGLDGMSTIVVAAHDGYRHLPSRAIHERCWEFSDEQVRIRDFVDGRGEINLDFTLNVHPDFEVVQNSINRFTARSRDGSADVIIETPGELACTIADFDFAPRFGFINVGTRLVARARLRLPQTLTSSLRFSSISADKS